MNSKSKMGEAFSDAFKDFEINPQPIVWNNVSKNISKKTGFSFGKSWILPVATASVISAILIGLLVFYPKSNKNDNNQTKSLSVDNQISIAKSESNHNDLKTEQNQISPEVKSDLINDKKVEIIEKPFLKADPKDSDNELVNNLNNTTINQKVSSQNQTVSNSQTHTSVNPQFIAPPATTEEKENTESPNISADPNIKYSSNPVICFGESAKLEVFGGEFYYWSSGEVSSSVMVEPVANSTYSVTVTDKNNHKHIHEFEVVIDKECTAVYLPSAFSPNNDGNNDVFKAVGENIQEFKMLIMSRDGRILFTTSDINYGWDGTFSGQLQPSQVYIYNVIYRNGHGKQSTLKGQFTLIR